MIKSSNPDQRPPVSQWIPKPEPYWADCWFESGYVWPHPFPIDGVKYEVKNGSEISEGIWDDQDSEFIMSADDLGEGKMFLQYAKGDMFREIEK